MAKQKPPKQKREAKTQIGDAESRVVNAKMKSLRDTLELTCPRAERVLGPDF